MNDTITEINKDTFWGLIREARDSVVRICLPWCGI